MYYEILYKSRKQGYETSLYHFGTDYAECNVHIIRYLRKNTEETENTWSDDMITF